MANYLCFTANTAGSNVGFYYTSQTAPSWTGYYSTDGNTWTSYTLGYGSGYTKITLNNIGDKVYFKGTYTAANDSTIYTVCQLTGSVAVSGNIMSFCSGDNFENVTTIPYAFMFYRFFASAGTKITSAPELPATTLTDRCYMNMFYNCTGLTKPPALPATTLANQCYYQMFDGCTGLTYMPLLPATTLPSYCYYLMFSSCSSLQVYSAPGSGHTSEYRIPVEGTATASGQYPTYYMFQGTTGDYASTDNVPINTTFYTQNKPIGGPLSVKLKDGNKYLYPQTSIDLVEGMSSFIPSSIFYETSAPTEANTRGLKFVVLTSEPATKYDGWFYIITEA